MILLVTKVDILKIDERSQEKTSADQQDQRKCHLRTNEETPGVAECEVESGGFTPRFVDCAQVTPVPLQSWELELGQS